MFTKIIKHSLVEQNLKVADLARLLETSYQNLDQKLKRDNFSEKEMLQIADALKLELALDLQGRLSSQELKSFEYQHIAKYRALDDQGKQIVDIILDNEYNRVNAMLKK